MKKSFRDKVRDALALRHIKSLTPGGKPVRSAEVNIVTAQVAFKHFWKKDFDKSIIWTTVWESGLKNHYSSGVIYIGDYKLTADGKDRKEATAKLARKFCNTVPLFTANGKEIERVIGNG